MEDATKFLYSGEQTFTRKFPLSHLLSLAPKWSLAGDAKLLGYLHTFSQGLLQQTQRINHSLEKVTYKMKFTSAQLQSTADDFNTLADTQFIENRVYDEDPIAQQAEVKSQGNIKPLMSKEEKEAELITNITMAVRVGSNVMKATKDTNYLQTLFGVKFLPPLIGSREFHHNFAKRKKKQDYADSKVSKQEANSSLDSSFKSDAGSSSAATSRRQEDDRDSARNSIPKKDDDNDDGGGDEDDFFSESDRRNNKKDAEKMSDQSSLSFRIHPTIHPLPKQDFLVSSSSSHVSQGNKSKVKSIFDNDDDEDGGDDSDDLFASITNIMNGPMKRNNKYDADDRAGVGNDADERTCVDNDADVNGGVGNKGNKDGKKHRVSNDAKSGGYDDDAEKSNVSNISSKPGVLTESSVIIKGAIYEFFSSSSSLAPKKEDNLKSIFDENEDDDDDDLFGEGMLKSKKILEAQPPLPHISQKRSSTQPQLTPYAQQPQLTQQLTSHPQQSRLTSQPQQPQPKERFNTEEEKNKCNLIGQLNQKMSKKTQNIQPQPQLQQPPQLQLQQPPQPQVRRLNRSPSPQRLLQEQLNTASSQAKVLERIFDEDDDDENNGIFSIFASKKTGGFTTTKSTEPTTTITTKTLTIPTTIIARVSTQPTTTSTKSITGKKVNSFFDDDDDDNANGSHDDDILPTKVKLSSSQVFQNNKNILANKLKSIFDDDDDDDDEDIFTFSKKGFSLKKDVHATITPKEAIHTIAATTTIPSISTTKNPPTILSTSTKLLDRTTPTSTQTLVEAASATLIQISTTDSTNTEKKNITDNKKLIFSSVFDELKKKQTDVSDEEEENDDDDDIFSAETNRSQPSQQQHSLQLSTEKQRTQAESLDQLQDSNLSSQSKLSQLDFDDLFSTNHKPLLHCPTKNRPRITQKRRPMTRRLVQTDQADSLKDEAFNQSHSSTNKQLIDHLEDQNVSDNNNDNKLRLTYNATTKFAPTPILFTNTTTNTTTTINITNKTPLTTILFTNKTTNITTTITYTTTTATTTTHITHTYNKAIDRNNNDILTNENNNDDSIVKTKNDNLNDNINKEPKNINNKQVNILKEKQQNQRKNTKNNNFLFSDGPPPIDDDDDKDNEKEDEDSEDDNDNYIFKSYATTITHSSQNLNKKNDGEIKFKDDGTCDARKDDNKSDKDEEDDDIFIFSQKNRIQYTDEKDANIVAGNRNNALNNDNDGSDDGDNDDNDYNDDDGDILGVDFASSLLPKKQTGFIKFDADVVLVKTKDDDVGNYTKNCGIFDYKGNKNSAMFNDDDDDVDDISNSFGVKSHNEDKVDGGGKTSTRNIFDDDDFAKNNIDIAYNIATTAATITTTTTSTSTINNNTINEYNGTNKNKNPAKVFIDDDDDDGDGDDDIFSDLPPRPAALTKKTSKTLPETNLFSDSDDEDIFCSRSPILQVNTKKMPSNNNTNNKNNNNNKFIKDPLSRF